MSIIWGVLKARNTIVCRSEVRQLGTRTERFATSLTAVYAQGRIGMGTQMNWTHARSGMDEGPVSDAAGNVVSFDGRLDNGREVAQLLELDYLTTSDSKIVLSAFLRWGEDCFARFTGDWAISLWSAMNDRLILARDHAGTRTLYLYRGRNGIVWSTYTDTFMGSRGELSFSKSYAAAYLSCSPIGTHTPYEDIRGVRPGHYLTIQDGIVRERAHWSPLVKNTVRYNRDQEYDEHFLTLFGQSVDRRTGPGTKILAQLSGGMDSTSIVCMSDHLRRRQDPETPLLDTISYYDDSEASLDERSYFAITEAQRGKRGIHLNTAMSQRTFDPPTTDKGLYHAPGADGFSVQEEERLVRLIWQKDYRVILSGIGGDEVLGGVPTGLPELADSLVTGDVSGLFRRSLAWCLVDRTPLISSLYSTGHYAFQLYAKGTSRKERVPPWISSRLKSSGDACAPLGSVRRLGIAPHRLSNALAWWCIMETLPHLNPQLLFRSEYRYPMLDKDLVEFLFSIPREQLVKPGRRRFMMRRALQGIVPDQILERRRKAFQLRAPLHSLQQAYRRLDRLWDDSRLADLGFVEVDLLRRELKRCADGEPEWFQPLFRTIAFELWLRALPPREQTPSSMASVAFPA